MKHLLIGFSWLALVVCEKSYSAQERFSITHVGIDPTTKVLFVGISPAATSSTCTHKGELKWLLATEGTKEIYSLLLAAQMTGKKIDTWVLEGASCVGNTATAGWVRVVT